MAITYLQVISISSVRRRVIWWSRPISIV